jgi:filamentous hemagglutinin
MSRTTTFAYETGWWYRSEVETTWSSQRCESVARQRLLPKLTEQRNGSQAGGAAAAPPRNGRFASDGQLQDHFNRHGGDFGARTAAEYEARANTFLNGPRGPGVLEKTRPNGDVVRYNPATDEFGVVKPDGTIRTYYKPDPARHGRPTNLDYFNAQ